MKVTCPTCNCCDRVRSIDNLPIYHQQEINPKVYFEIDDEAYITFKCDRCDQRFEKEFDLVPKVVVISNIASKCPKCANTNSVDALPSNSTGDYRKVVCDECENQYFVKAK